MTIICLANGLVGIIRIFGVPVSILVTDSDSLVQLLESSYLVKEFSLLKLFFVYFFIDFDICVLSLQVLHFSGMTLGCVLYASWTTCLYAFEFILTGTCSKNETMIENDYTNLTKCMEMILL